MIWNIQNCAYDLSHQGMIMGILNVTPDSFSDGGAFDSVDRALEHAHEMISAGATIIDVGGESTRPGSLAVPAEKEMQRVLPVIEALAREFETLISIDTSKASVAEAALQAGAHIVNDVSGGVRDPEMLPLWSRTDAGLVVMHSQGNPETMQDDPRYGHVLAEVRAFFSERLRSCQKLGISTDRIVFDPGIGFGKTLEHNLELLKGLDELVVAERPLLLGVSRKSFIASVLGDSDLSLRDWPTVALTAQARRGKTRIFRVHDVLPNVQALKMVEAILAVK